ncbi:MAG: L,D-transpeptidase family protein [Thermodesulfobacteriota bacterium]
MRGGLCGVVVGFVCALITSCSSPDMWGWHPSPLPQAIEEPRTTVLSEPEAPSVPVERESSLQASLGPQVVPPESPPEPLTADWIKVIKHQRTMLLMRQGEVIRQYRISLGKNPYGPKMRQGDNRTPEGLYLISGRNPRSAYHLALRISYPDPIDSLQARSMGVEPGGNVMIHGLPNGVKSKYSMEKDWTNGCIAVSNEEIEEIWELVPDGTPIEILP